MIKVLGFPIIMCIYLTSTNANVSMYNFPGISLFHSAAKLDLFLFITYPVWVNSVLVYVTILPMKILTNRFKSDKNIFAKDEGWKKKEKKVKVKRKKVFNRNRKCLHQPAAGYHMKRFVCMEIPYVAMWAIMNIVTYTAMRSMIWLIEESYLLEKMIVKAR